MCNQESVKLKKNQKCLTVTAKKTEAENNQDI